MEPFIATGTSASRFVPSAMYDERLKTETITIPFHVAGSGTEQIADAITRINVFLSNAGDEYAPVYFSWRNSNTPEPVWGQKLRRLRIESGSAQIGDMYGVASLASRAVPNCTMTLVVSMIEGVRQDLAFAKGSVSENYIGSLDGSPSGVIVSQETTNLVPNPIFANTTPLILWSTGAEVSATHTHEDKYTLRSGATSAVVTRNTLAAGTHYFATSVTAASTATHCISAIVKVLSGGSVYVLTPRLLAYYDGAIETTNFTSLGDDWYLVWGTAAGVASAKLAGISMEVKGVDILVASVQFEAGEFPTAHFCGNDMWAIWNGAEHYSISDRAAGVFVLPSSAFQSPSSLTFEFVWRAGSDRDGSLTGDVWLVKDSVMDAGVGVSVDGEIFATDGTNTATGTAAAISIGTEVVIHATFGTSGIKVYRNGALVGSVGARVPLTTAATWALGSDPAGTGHANGVFMVCNIYDKELTATNVLDRYNELYPIASDGVACGSIPWLWTSGGDGRIHDIYDAGGVPFGVIGGIVGGVPAQGYFAIDRASASYGGNVMLATYATERYVDHTKMYETKTTAVDTSAATIAEWTLSMDAWRQLAGQQMYVFFEIIDGTGSTDLNVYAQVISGAAMSTTSTSLIAVSSSIYRTFCISGLVVPEFMRHRDNLITDNRQLTIRIIGAKPSGGATNITVHGELIFGDVMYSNRETTDTESRIMGRECVSHTVSSGIMQSAQVQPVIGSVLYLYPYKTNYIFASEFTFGTAPWLPQDVNYISYSPVYRNC